MLIVALAPDCTMQTLQPFSILAFIAAVLFVVYADDIVTAVVGCVHPLARAVRNAFINALLLLV